VCAERLAANALGGTIVDCGNSTTAVTFTTLAIDVSSAVQIVEPRASRPALDLSLPHSPP